MSWIYVPRSLPPDLVCAVTWVHGLMPRYCQHFMPQQVHTQPIIAESQQVHTLPPSITEPQQVHSPPPSIAEPQQVHTPPPIIVELQQVHTPPSSVAEPQQVHTPPSSIAEPQQVHTPPPRIAEVPQTQRSGPGLSPPHAWPGGFRVPAPVLPSPPCGFQDWGCPRAD